MHCSECGQEFECGAQTPAAGASCWCAEFPSLALIQPGRGCLCEKCLRDALSRERGQADKI